MKTLTDLAKDWNQHIRITFNPYNENWQAVFANSYCVSTNEFPTGTGKTPDHALRSLAKKIRGRMLEFTSPHLQTFQVPEVITS